MGYLTVAALSGILQSLPIMHNDPTSSQFIIEDRFDVHAHNFTHAGNVKDEVDDS